MFKFKSIFNSLNYGDQSELIWYYHLWSKISGVKIILLPIKFFDIKEKKLFYNNLGNYELFNCISDYTIDNFLLKKILLIGKYIQIILYFLILFLKKIFFSLKRKNIWDAFQKRYENNEIYDPNPLSVLYKSDHSFLYKNLIKNYKKIKRDKTLLNNLNFRLTKKNFKYCDESLKKLLGFDYKEKFIILHVRESNFHKDQNNPYGYMRNAKIKSYIPSIKYFIDKGYKVVRLGDEGMERIEDLDYLGNNFIDYAHLDIKKKKKVHELFFIQNCEFFFGTHSGVAETSRLFSKRLVVSNIFPSWNWAMNNRTDSGIIKKTKFLFNILSPFEQIDLHLDIILNQGYEGFKNKKFEFIDNSENEILELAKSSLSKTPDLSYSQIRYNKYRIKKVLHFLNCYSIAFDRRGKPNEAWKVMIKFNILLSNGGILNL